MVRKYAGLGHIPSLEARAEYRRRRRAMSGTTGRIFISHASRDGQVADSLCAALEQRGLLCWISSRAFSATARNSVKPLSAFEVR